MAFNAVAKKIIKETISSAIFIDDRALENFKSKNYKFKDDQNRTIKLYNDFKEKECLLHSFKYTKVGWRKHKRFYLKNKDLLILDWQLVGDDHSDALKILEEAVIEKSLHFVCIYTRESKDVVKNELNRFYRGYIDSENITQIRESLAESEIDDFWELDDNHGDKQDLDELINNVINARPDDQENELNCFKDTYNISDELIKVLSNIVANNTSHSFSILKTILSKEEKVFSPNRSMGFFKTSNHDQHTLYINHTIVTILTKHDVEGDQLYETFFDSLMKEQNIFLSIMGLEMRNRFRENSAFIGKDFDQLSEDAFFHHRSKNKDNLFIFNDYLREILKDQVASFMYESDLEIFNVLDEYYTSIDGGVRLADFQSPSNKPSLIKELFKLNYFYNRININHRKSNDFLRFGDVFETSISNQTNQGEVVETKYFICITPHCDCIRPSGIKNQFWFVEGELVTNQENVLKSTDSKFVSFVKDAKGEIVAIDWRMNGKFCQPFTMKVPVHKFTKNLDVDYHSQNLKLLLITSIKENYAQRIANEASGYNLRVGIDFVKK